ncbi:MAG: PfkB family carbohydrate kinase [Stappiaceae bacterium]
MKSGAANKRVVCIGRVYCDLIFSGLPRMPALGEELFAEGIALHAGGGAYITAAYLAALGRQVSLVATLPASPFDAIVTAELSENGIDSRFCKPSEEQHEPQITVAMVHGDDRAFVTKRVGAAFDDQQVGWLSEPDICHLHIGEVTTHIDNPWLISEARRRGLSVSLDCGWDDTAFLHKDLGALIGDVDVFLPNEAEATHLLSKGHQMPLAPLTIVKKGSGGAEAHDRTQRQTNAAQRVEVVDTTGAGDAFNAGFLNDWLAGQPLTDCLEAGNVCGGLAVQHVGGASGLRKMRSWMEDRSAGIAASAS